jgi:tetratricopeptide (TPR) repeat protein
MKKAKWMVLAVIMALSLSFGCKQGMDTASDPIKKQAESHYTKARRLFLSCDPDKYTEAIKEYQLALDLWDEYPEALAGLAEAISMWRGFSIGEEEFGEAYKYAQRAIRLSPELSAGYRAMADLCRHKGEYERALRLADMALKYEPKNAENLYVKGSAFLTMNPEQAYRLLLEAKNLNPELPKIYLNLGAACQKLGKYDDAIKYLETYQQMVPPDISAYCYIALNKMAKREKETLPEVKKRMLEEAENLFKLAIAKSDREKKPWQSSYVLLAYKSLARLSVDQSNYPAAIDYLKKAEAIYEEDVELQYLFGITYKQMGNRTAAKQHLQKALSIAPSNEDIKKELKSL